MEDILHNNGIGDFFISDEQKAMNESIREDADLQRQTQEAMLDYMQNKKVSATMPAIDQQSVLIIGSVAVIMIFVIIIKT
jgi:hypothetical protein